MRRKHHRNTLVVLQEKLLLLFKGLRLRKRVSGNRSKLLGLFVLVRQDGLVPFLIIVLCRRVGLGGVGELYLLLASHLLVFNLFLLVLLLLAERLGFQRFCHLRLFGRRDVRVRLEDF